MCLRSLEKMKNPFKKLVFEPGPKRTKHLQTSWFLNTGRGRAEEPQAFRKPTVGVNGLDLQVLLQPVHVGLILVRNRSPQKSKKNKSQKFFKKDQKNDEKCLRKANKPNRVKSYIVCEKPLNPSQEPPSLQGPPLSIPA